MTRADPATWDIRTLLWMDRPIAIVVVAAFCISAAMRAATYLDDAACVWPIVVALVLTTAGAFAIVSVPGDPLPWPVALALTALGPVTCLCVLPQITADHWIMSDLWFMRPLSVILCFLSVRGRIWHAAAGSVLTISSFSLWCAVTGQGAVSGIRISAIMFAPVLVSVFVARTIRPMAAVVFTLREREADRAADEAMIRAGTAEREKQLAALDRSARPLLEAAAAGAEFDDATRAQCAVLEEQLRDLLRAPIFAEDAGLRDATAAARRRGARVYLLDDGGLDAALAARVRARLIDELDAVRCGTLTARALPVGRDVTATIVTEEAGRTRRVEFDAAGSVRVEVNDDLPAHRAPADTPACP